jgi:hypothetical protein
LFLVCFWQFSKTAAKKTFMRFNIKPGLEVGLNKFAYEEAYEGILEGDLFQNNYYEHNAAE